MKVMITSQGNDLSAAMDKRFGRAAKLLLVDSETGSFEAHDNQVNLNAPSGAGIQTAQNAANLGAEVVITGNVGPNAIRTLKAADIKVFLANADTVAAALEQFKAGSLEEVAQANVEGHWA